MSLTIKDRRSALHGHLHSFERELESASPFFCSEEEDTLVTRYSRHEFVGALASLVCIGVFIWLSPRTGHERFAAAILAFTWVVWSVLSLYVTSPTFYPGQLGTVSGHRAMNFYSLLSGATVLVTGGHTSPCVPVLVLVALHQLNYPRRERMKAILSVLVPALLTVGILLFFDHEALQPFQWQEAIRAVWPFVVLLLLLLAVAYHGIYIVERVRPPTTVLQKESFPRFGFDPDNLLLYSSIMVRAIKLYRAEAGMVITASKRSPEGAEEAMAYTCILALNWPGADPEPRQGKSRGILLDNETRGFEYVLDALGEALHKRIGHFAFSCGKNDPLRLRKGIIFRIGPQADPHDQKFIVLGANRAAAFRAPLSCRSAIFWTLSLREMETAFLSAEWTRLLRSTDSLDSLKHQLKSVCNDLVPEALRPVKTDIVPRIAGEQPAYIRGPRAYGVSLEDDPEPDRCVSTVTVDLLNPHGRWTHADVYVYVDSPAALLATKPEALASTKKLLNEFLAHVFRGSMLLRLFQRAEEDSDTGWAKLAWGGNDQPVDSQGLRFITPGKISELAKKNLPSGSDYDKEFERFGFSIIATDSLMKAWIPEVKSAGSQSICWKTYLRPDPQIQNGACRNCAVIKQLHSHLQGAGRRGNVDAPMQPPLPAPAPAMVGNLKITKHFFLSCELEFHPEVRSQVRNIIEQVEDRTLYFERGLFSNYLNEASLNRSNTHFTSDIYSRLAEAFGRLFHADVVSFVATGGIKQGSILHRYCRIGYGIAEGLASGDDEAFAKREAMVLKALRETSSDQDYTATLAKVRAETKTFLFGSDEKELHGELLPSYTLSGIRNEVAASRRHRRAMECLRASSGWVAAFPGGFRRILVVGIPFSEVAILICTGDPQEWEYHAATPALGLLPRRAEMSSTYEMAEQTGTVLKGVQGIQPDLYLAVYRDVKQTLEHEMKHATKAINRNLGMLIRLLEGGLQEIEEAVVPFAPMLKESPLWDWLRRIEQVASGKLQLAEGDVVALRREYRVILGSQALAIDMDRLSEVGFSPSLLPGIEVIKGSTPEHLDAIVKLLRHYYFAIQAGRRMESIGLYINRLRYHEWSPDGGEPTYLHKLLSSSLDRVSLEARVKVRLDVADKTATLADGEQLALVADNLIRNAVDAANDLNYPNTVVIEARLNADNWPLLRVSNEGPEIPKDLQAVLSLAHGQYLSTKGAKGSGMGVYSASQAAISLGGWLMYEFGPHPFFEKPVNNFVFLPRHATRYDP